MVDLSRLVKRANGVKVDQAPEEPVWKGPIVDGITYSMLSRFLTCRERFRLAVIEGLRTADTFNHKIEYGHMWHECERAVSAKKPWMQVLEEYYLKLLQKYKWQNISYEIRKWYMICRTQFPIYEKYWREHADNQQRTPIAQEYNFCVDYPLDNGRVVKMRGKMDAFDLIGKPKSGEVDLQENKTKGDIDEENIQKQLVMDCQTMFYLTALYKLQQVPKKQRTLLPAFYDTPIGGVRYNVIRRPLSGGKGNIKQHKATAKKPAESDEAFYSRLASIIDGTGLNRNGDETPGPAYFFMRWKANILKQDVDHFNTVFLRPILHQLCNWYDWVSTCYQKGITPFSVDNTIHWQHPFGVDNMINEGFSHDMDEYLRTGSMIGLRRVEKLFEELD